ncbi:TonB-dependent receptor [Daejeonella lutea]|uniref:Outer membrane receptor proteins, mostly Fe transport n=1 Tax=Daejeonella lutea TaxID=572036 RepID=A0A1T5AI53_9SPHI|nr:TonB-dependent receptor [Daejeonella lutea]SKB34636.1 Outer membrane receptor proteins, mostly Fe transport [Daejeonella lutea]
MKRTGNFCHWYFFPTAALCCFLLISTFLWSTVAHAQDVTSIKGIVRSSKGELLSGVTVQVKGSKYITQTDRDGEYLINPVPVNITLSFSRLGYKTLTLDLGLLPMRENVQDVELVPEVQSLDEINITEKFSGSNFKIIEPDKFSAYPSASGSFENLIKNMPGVSANNELSSQYSVRGGNFDENLLYLNDIEIFRPLSVSKGQQESLGFVNPDMATHVKFSAGGFEARYGDKLSSVLDVRYSRPDSLSLEASASLLGSSATLKVPLKNSYILAGVRIKKNQDLLERQNLAGNYSSKFSDYQLLYRQNFTPKLNVSLFGNYNRGELNVVPGQRETEFGTSDEVLKLFVNYDGVETTEFKSAIGAVTFAYNFSNSASIKWISSITGIDEHENTDLLGWYTFDERDGLSPGNGGSLLGRGSQYDFAKNKLNTLIYNTELRSYKQYKKSFLELGIRLQHDQINDDIEEYIGLDSTAYSRPPSANWRYSDVITQQNDVTIRRINGFFQNTVSISPYLTFAVGVRANLNSFTRELLISPRFSLMYYPDNSDGLLLRFSAGSYSQAPYYRELRNFNGSINPNALSQQSYQLLSGIDRKFDGLGTRLKFSSEIYYKFLTRLTPYKTEDLKVRYFADQESKGYAAGVDLSLSGNFAKDLESTFRLSLMKTEEDIKDDWYFITGGSGLPNNIVRPGYLKRPSDQRVNLGILFQDRLLQNPTYKVHLNLLFASALPTGPSGSQRYEDVFKIPPYKRADIGFSKDFADPDSRKILPFIKKYFQSLSAHAEIFNLLNNKNTASYLWLKDVGAVQYAVPNYLTFRKFNFRIIARLKTR